MGSKIEFLPPSIHAAIAFIYGAVVGSFLNVCIWRMPRDESLWHPPSHCPQCDTRLRFWDLVPLLSFLWQRQRCRYCGARISGRYFGVELLTALLFAALGWRFGITLDTILLALWVGLLVATLFIDLEHFIIPDELNAAGVVLGVGRDLLKLYLPATGPAWTMVDLAIPGGLVVHVPRSILGALCFMAALYLVRLLGSVAFKKEAMGLGDVKLAAAIGANLVLGQILVAAFASVLVGSVVGIVMLATGRLEGEAEEGVASPDPAALESFEGVVDTGGEAAEPLELQQGEGSPTTSCDQEEEWDVPPGALPFGPFLVVGVLIAIFWGNELFATYLRHVGLGP